MELKDLLDQENINKENGEAKESPLKSLEADLRTYNDFIKEVAAEILTEGISPYPIFVAHQHEAKLGELILDKIELNTNWTINASTLDEFVERGIIHAEKKDKFIKQFKDPNDFMCLFVMVPEGANFIFFPYN
jgi:hypothetical protein